MVRYFKGDIRYDTLRKVLIKYDSSKPHPHCNTYTHINEVHVDIISHLEEDDLLYLFSCVDRDYQAPDPFEREKPKTRAREVYTNLWHEMIFWWNIDRDTHKMRIKEWMEKFQHNQYRIFYKRRLRFIRN